MANDSKPSLERFQIHGNVLKLTTRFDPRYQSRAGMELMNIVSSLANEGEGPEVVLDICDSNAFPSMMLGILSEAKDLTDKAGKKLKVRLKATTYNRLQMLGLTDSFAKTAHEGDGQDNLELVAGTTNTPVQE